MLESSPTTRRGPSPPAPGPAVGCGSRPGSGDARRLRPASRRAVPPPPALPPARRPVAEQRSARPARAQRGRRAAQVQHPAARPDRPDRPDRRSSRRKAGRTGRKKATLGSTSYDAAEDEPFEPDWSGSTWYGASSGTYWTINPKEYADPRKHGPEYQRRARRVIDGVEDDPTSEDATFAGEDLSGQETESGRRGASDVPASTAAGPIRTTRPPTRPTTADANAAQRGATAASAGRRRTQPVDRRQRRPPPARRRRPDREARPRVPRLGPVRDRDLVALRGDVGLQPVHRRLRRLGRDLDGADPVRRHRPVRPAAVARCDLGGRNAGRHGRGARRGVRPERRWRVAPAGRSHGRARRRARSSATSPARRSRRAGDWGWRRVP